MSFERKTAESLTERALRWIQGSTDKLTDFRVGSVTRTIIEAVMLTIEELYDKVYRSLKSIVESNLYAAIGFSKLPATYATGVATFSRSTPADQPYYIAKGTTLLTTATANSGPIKFYTTEEAILATGSLAVSVPVICETIGSVGAIQAFTLTEFIQKPTGVETVTNNAAFTGATDEESFEAQKERFTRFMEAQARGVLGAIEAGAMTACITNGDGVVTEKVLSAKATEDLVSKKGEVLLYVYTGSATVSPALTLEINKVLTGYYDSEGKPVFGYKAAGILVTIATPILKPYRIRLKVAEKPGVDIVALKAKLESEVIRYMASLKIGQPLLHSTLLSTLLSIDGIYDLRVNMAKDSATPAWSSYSIIVEDDEIITFVGPIAYET